MKRIRRTTMEIVHRQQRVTLLAPTSPGPAAPVPAGSELPQVCPSCGSGWLVLHEAARGVGGPAELQLNAALNSLELHLHSAPDGRLWTCRSSFDQLCNSLKETL